MGVLASHYVQRLALVRTRLRFRFALLDAFAEIWEIMRDLARGHLRREWEGSKIGNGPSRTDGKVSRESIRSM
jgi:hypothetical protein